MSQPDAAYSTPQNVAESADSSPSDTSSKSGSTIKRRTLVAVGLAALLPAGLFLWLKSPKRTVSRGEFDLSQATIPQKEIIHGGPRKDGIPSLTNPRMIGASQADSLKATDRVIGVVIKGEARAYPLKVLNHHEAVNDRIADVPFAVVFCPLCDSASVFDRRTPEGELEFGISGLLYNSNVLLFDRQKTDEEEGLWSQMMAQSVTGPHAKQTLATLPVELTTWDDWLKRHPNSQVLWSRASGSRNDNTELYAHYLSNDRLIYPVKPIDGRLPQKTPVLGIWNEKAARAYPIREFEKLTEPLKFDAELDGQKLTLAYNPAAKSLRVVKAERGIQWMYAFWFAWYAFHSDTKLYAFPAEKPDSPAEEPQKRVERFQPDRE
jgi:hypothetical protein